MRDATPIRTVVHAFTLLAMIGGRKRRKTSGPVISHSIVFMSLHHFPNTSASLMLQVGGLVSLQNRLIDRAAMFVEIERRKPPLPILTLLPETIAVLLATVNPPRSSDL